MYDYSVVLGLLLASAADLRLRALSCQQAEVANKTTERTLRNRAQIIVQRLQGIAEPQRRSFVEAAIRHL
ncbi:MAG TPA: hypothetical protein VN808_20595 [Stellaceae bacterium]|nr:hypothetical protein [Stellaceae bacterium]